MFRLKNKDAEFPPLYEHVERQLPNIKDKGWDKVGNFILREKKDFMPQPGLQENFLRCESNLIFLCGAASMGKSFAMLMKMLYGMDKPGFSGRFISMRLADSKKGTSTYRDTMELLGNYANCEISSSDSPTFAWPKYNSAVQLIHSNFNVDNPKEWDDFKELAKKNQASLIEVDEATDMPYKMFTYWFSRNRDSSGMKPQMVLSFNAEHAHWTTTLLLLAGYIDPNTWYLKPEMNGKTRYFYAVGDAVEDLVWGDTREEVCKAARIEISDKDRAAGMTEADMVKSFTMFTGEAADNLKLVSITGGGSIANLHAVGKTQRSILKGAYFGEVDKEELTVSKQMVLDMFSNPESDDENIYATMDVGGGAMDGDDVPMIIWKGLRIIAIKFFRGTQKELVDWINDRLDEYDVPVEHFAFDATGIGYYLKSFTSGMPITPNRRCIQEIDANGNAVVVEQYFNLRSQLLGRTKVLIEKGEMSIGLDKNLIIPYGKNGQTRQLIDVLFDEVNIFKVTTKNRKIYYRSKDEYKARFHASSNIMDPISYRAIWELDARPKKQPEKEIEDDAYYGLYNNYYYNRGRSVYI